MAISGEFPQLPHRLLGTSPSLRVAQTSHCVLGAPGERAFALFISSTVPGKLWTRKNQGDCTSVFVFTFLNRRDDILSLNEILLQQQVIETGKTPAGKTQA